MGGMHGEAYLVCKSERREGRVECTMIRCAIFPSRGWDGYCLMSLFILYVSVRERNMVLLPASLMREPTLPDMY
jgi:hypothetical protein